MSCGASRLSSLRADEVDELVSRCGHRPGARAARAGVVGRASMKIWAPRPSSVPPLQPYPWHGKRGVHSEHLSHLLAEMQHLPRTYPGAHW